MTTTDDTAPTTDTAPAAPAPAPAPGAFGTVFGPSMSVAEFDGTSWSAARVVATENLSLHPGTHALHYGSACFEGLKAHRQPDGSARAFRADAHNARLRQSAGRLCLPEPSEELVDELLTLAVDANLDVVPDSPGALYLRPTLIGTDPSIGAAATPSRTALFYVLACPVGDYLPPRPLTISVETDVPRTTPQFGVVKAGANYAMALTPIMAARRAYGADQVLFAPGRVLQETGASNIVLIEQGRLLTPALTDAYLHGVTRDSLLRLARARGWNVEERDVTLDETLEWIARPGAELALTGTAAVVAPVGTLVVDGEAHTVGDAGASPLAGELRQALVDVQTGKVSFDW